MSFDPREIPNNFRMQPLVEEGLAYAKALLESKTEADVFSTEEYVHLALIYLEEGKSWSKMEAFATLVLATNPSEEQKATALYALGTMQREQNHTEEALHSFHEAQILAQSDWLKSNLLRNIGLVCLKTSAFVQAADYFSAGYELVTHSSDQALRGSLPALSNYIALSKARAALAVKTYPTEGISQFSDTTDLYDTLFTEKGIVDEVMQRQSHDFISHCVHQGMMLCETYEQWPSAIDVITLQRAEKFLQEALTSRKENKADGQRLGDVEVWLGRVYKSLNNPQAAKKAFDEALASFRLVLPEDAKQIKDVKTRLSNLAFEISMSVLPAQSALSTSSGSAFDMKEVDEEISTLVVSGKK